MVVFPFPPSTWNRTAVVLAITFRRLFRVLTLCMTRFPVTFFTVGPYDTVVTPATLTATSSALVLRAVSVIVVLVLVRLVFIITMLHVIITVSLGEKLSY